MKIPPRKKTEDQLAAEKAKAELNKAWNAPYKPPGKLVFDVPKKDAAEMTKPELRAAWANSYVHRDPNAEKPRFEKPASQNPRNS
jgi:hypothetical protein